MNRRVLFALILLAVSMPVAAQQYKDTEDTPKDAVIKRDETVQPEGRYANMPDEAVPYRRFTKPTTTGSCAKTLWSTTARPANTRMAILRN